MVEWAIGNWELGIGRIGIRVFVNRRRVKLLNR